MSAIRGTSRTPSPGILVFLLVLGLTSETPRAQSPGLFFVAGRNVNTVGAPPVGGSNPHLVGDPLFKQQNEVDCDVSPYDARLVLCAVNDYRGIQMVGDSWIGVTMSDDGGLTWKSGLQPDHPVVPIGVGAADPVVATVPGLGLVGYITISRADGRGTLGLARWMEQNREYGERYVYQDTVVIGAGTPGRFADKPSMTTVLNPVPGTTIVAGREIPSGTIHFGYAVFPGNTNNSSSEIYHIMSTDYGATWSSPKKLSASIGINQGIDIAADAADVQSIVATWRRVKDNNEPDAIMFSRSTDGGRSWSKAAEVWKGRFFDQESAESQFRTRSMPSVVHDGHAFHIFWSARGFAPNPDDARVLVATLQEGSWTDPQPIQSHDRGHQLMPTAAVAGGRVQVNWIDSRNNTRADSFRKDLDDYTYAEPSDGKTYVYRQAVDVYAAQAPAGASLDFSGGSQMVSKYRTALVPVDGKEVLAPVEYNFINARLFRQGNLPFHGDYHAVAGQRYRPDPTLPGGWIANTRVSASHAVFYSAFTDNRDVRGYVWLGPTNAAFTSPTSAGGTLQGEAGDELPAECSVPEPPARDGALVWTPTYSLRSRDQNVYAAATLPGLMVDSASGSKPGNGQRAYVVTVYNLVPDPRTYDLTLAPSAGVTASWNRCESDGCTRITELREISIRARSSITRTVYLETTNTNVRPRVVVTVSGVDGGHLEGSVILNADPNAPEMSQPDDALPRIVQTEVYQADILARQVSLYSTALQNPEVVPVPSAQMPRIEFPRIEFPRIEFTAETPRIEFPRIEFRAETPRIEFPRIEFQAIENPRIEFSAPQSDVTEITWPVTTNGANTTTAMTAAVFVNGDLSAVKEAQILVTVPNATSVPNGCTPGDTTSAVDSQVIVETTVATGSLAMAAPDPVDPPAWQPSFPVKPGQTVWVTLRLRGVQDAGLASRAGLRVRSQPSAGAQPDAIDALPIIDLGDLATGLTVEGNTPGGARVGYVVSARNPVDGSNVPVVCDHPESDAFFPLGTARVTCTATNDAGTATAGFDVIVRDTTPPSVAVSPLTAEATSANGAVVSYTATASDAVSEVRAVTCAPASGSLFTLGPTTLTCSATDGVGNIGEQSFTVTVVDTTPPSVTVPSNITAEATSAGGAFVSYTASARDLVSGALAPACMPASGALFPLGTTQVTCTATDAAGKTGTGSFAVTVRDTARPVIAAHVNVSAIATSRAGVAVNYELSTASDAVGVAALSCSPPPGSTFAIGVTTVTCDASDAAGNKATPTTFTVTVVLNYGFIGLGAPASAKQGNSVPLVWQYRLDGVVVDTRTLVPVVRIRRLTSCTAGATETDPFFDNTQYPGNSNFQYNTITFAWQFNWQSKTFSLGCYHIYIRLLNESGAFVQNNGPFKIQLR